MRILFITQIIMVLFLVGLCFVLFKNVTNFFNVFIVPLILFAFFKDKAIEEIAALSGALLLFVLLIFHQQIFFALLYCVIAYLMNLNFKDEERRTTLLTIIVVSLAVFLGFVVTTLLTDDVFGQHFLELFMSAFQQNVFAYSVLMWVVSFFISLGLLYFGEKLDKALNSLN